MADTDADAGAGTPDPAILDAVGDALDRGEPAVLATVVGVEGRAYRRPGAKMLVKPEDDGVGHVTPGCLEPEVRALASEVLDAGEPRVETYDLSSGDDVWGLGVGCDGVVDVFLEPVDESLRPAVEAQNSGDGAAAIVVLSGDGADLQRGDRLYFRPEDGLAPLGDDSTDTGTSVPDWLATSLSEPAETLLGQDGAETVRLEHESHTVTAFVDAITPPPRLVAVGAGHDVGPVVDLARRNGFYTTVVSFRGGVDLADRFPAADRTVTTSPADLREDLEHDEATYVVVMTHNFVDDRLAVGELLDSPVPYVGLMGPRERFEEMREAFRDEGRHVDESDLERLYTPVGLDLGAGSPYGIATSIVAEVLAVRGDRAPRHLSDRDGTIHDRVEVEAPDRSN